MSRQVDLMRVDLVAIDLVTPRHHHNDLGIIIGYLLQEIARTLILP